MASNHTPHYSLSQWQATDEVVRTDFNADNAKIDAALFGKLGRLELISETVYDNQIDARSSPALDVAGFDWGKWEFVLALFEPAPTVMISDSQTMWVDAAGASWQGTSRTQFGRRAPGPRAMLFHPGHDGSRPAFMAVLPGTELYYSEQPYTDITTLSFTFYGEGGGYIRGGSKVLLLGIR